MSGMNKFTVLLPRINRVGLYVTPKFAGPAGETNFI